MDFDRSMTKIESLVGVNRKQVDQWRRELLRIGPALGKTPTELADALFAITSAGARGAEAIDILTGSAKASAVGLGATRDVAFAVGSAVNAFASQGLTAAQATDVMTAAVRAGNLEAADLAGALGNVMGIANSMGVSFAESTAFIASFTKAGADANIAATSLVAVMSTFLKTTPQQVKQLEDLGISVQKVRDAIKKDGLAVAMVRLISTFDGNIDALGKVIGNVRALRGALSTAASQGKDYIKIARDITNSAGATEKAFKRTTETMAHQFDEFKSKVTVLGIAFGTVLTPMLLDAVDAVIGYVDNLNAAQVETHKWIAVVTLAAVAMGPLIWSLGMVGTLFAGLAFTTIPAATAAVRNFWMLIRVAMVDLAGVVAIFAGIGKGVVFLAKGLALVVSVLGLLATATFFKSIDDLREFFQDWPLIGKWIDNFYVEFEKLGRHLAIIFIQAFEKIRSAWISFSEQMVDVPEWAGGGAAWEERIAKNHAAAARAAHGIAVLRAEIAALNETGRATFTFPSGDSDPNFYDPNAGKNAGVSGLDLSLIAEARAQQAELERLFADTIKGFDSVPQAATENLDEVETKFGSTLRSVEGLFEDTSEFIRINLGGSIASSMDEMMTGMLRGTRDLESFVEIFTDSMVGLFEDAFSQIIRSKLNFDAVLEKNFMQDLLPMIADFAFEAMKLVGGLFGWTPSASAQVSNAFNAPAGNVGVPTGVGADFMVPVAAHGGITLGKTLAMVGDNPSGREAIIPLERWDEIMGGAGGVEVHVHAPSPLEQKNEGRDNSGKRMLEMIFEGAKSAVAQDISRGGDVSKAIQNTFGSQRTGGV